MYLNFIYSKFFKGKYEAQEVCLEGRERLKLKTPSRWEHGYLMEQHRSVLACVFSTAKEKN